MNWSHKKAQLSMRGAGRVFLSVVLLYVMAAGIYSMSFLGQMEDDARFTQQHQIPLILAQNRNALKVERLASLLRSVYLANDRKLERQIQLQLQALAQSFTLDDDKLITDGAKSVAESARDIANYREKARTAGEIKDGVPLSFSEEQTRIADFRREATAAYAKALRATEVMSSNLSNNAALLADSMSADIQKSARQIKVGWVVFLTLPVLFIVSIMWVVKRHIVVPIKSAVLGLETISKEPDALPNFTRPLFRELGTIVDAVKAYGEMSQDLRRTNSMLQILSDRDELTGLANRRTFETTLRTEFDIARAHQTDVALLMIDLDHFKSINDTYGHPAGDACLKAAAHVINAVCLAEDGIATRYGGEEFAAILPRTDLLHAAKIAETIRLEIDALSITTATGVIPVTASIGVSALGKQSPANQSVLVSEADNALYRAKRGGRNAVICHEEASQKYA
jgi:diguanylate cyclase (GGDEF)-like protein